MNTLFLLMSHYGKPTVPLADICNEYFGMSEHTAAVKAKSNQLPIPVFRLANSNKSPLMIHLEDLSKLIDERKQKAQEAHEYFNM